MSRKQPTPVPAGAAKPEPPPPLALDPQTSAERARILSEIESVILDWSYPGDVAGNVKCTLFNLGLFVSGGEGGTGVEAATAWFDAIEARSDEAYEAAKREIANERRRERRRKKA